VVAAGRAWTFAGAAAGNGPRHPLGARDLLRRRHPLRLQGGCTSRPKVPGRGRWLEPAQPNRKCRFAPGEEGVFAGRPRQGKGPTVSPPGLPEPPSRRSSEAMPCVPLEASRKRRQHRLGTSADRPSRRRWRLIEIDSFGEASRKLTFDENSPASLQPLRPTCWLAPRPERARPTGSPSSFPQRPRDPEGGQHRRRGLGRAGDDLGPASSRSSGERRKALEFPPSRTAGRRRGPAANSVTRNPRIQLPPPSSRRRIRGFACPSWRTIFYARTAPAGNGCALRSAHVPWPRPGPFGSIRPGVDHPKRKDPRSSSTPAGTTGQPEGGRRCTAAPVRCSGPSGPGVRSSRTNGFPRNPATGSGPARPELGPGNLAASFDVP